MSLSLPAGTVVAYSTATNKADRFPYISLMHKDVTLRGFWFWKWLKENSETVPEAMDKVCASSPLPSSHSLVAQQMNPTFQMLF